MRRKDREIRDFNVIKQIIADCDTIHIGLADGDYPYILPMSFGHEVVNECIYFYLHGAKVGRKIDLMKKNGVCSFEMDCSHSAAMDPDRKEATMHYRSIMGKAEIEFLEGENKIHALNLIMDHYNVSRGKEYETAHIPHTAVIRLKVTEYSAKQNPN
ncbi:MAG: pyridoxamine 5'-phosphate oxidase family protein [Christensenellaceae bacterium]|nr:pyridoxamine 5'-phosphate oxidase family protein [Christensenellaceae bacterium]